MPPRPLAQRGARRSRLPQRRHPPSRNNEPWFSRQKFPKASTSRLAGMAASELIAAMFPSRPAATMAWGSGSAGYSRSQTDDTITRRHVACTHHQRAARCPTLEPLVRASIWINSPNQAYLVTLHEHVLTHGTPLACYADRHGIFRT